MHNYNQASPVVHCYVNLRPALFIVVPLSKQDVNHRPKSRTKNVFLLSIETRSRIGASIDDHQRRCRSDRIELERRDIDQATTTLWFDERQRWNISPQQRNVRDRIGLT